ncbi:metal ABC transporter ATP-binding protein [uncultured Finegoldia sp.]|uniref:metal ABC transporter ATP-binding protein n=1 Tax=uncultured Finegoldia sp. TaxID=328009 RepID=UPI00262F4EA5|nr:ATP-binding cassette domain-containing protein [uncultured Finegoldia sp.]
MSKEVICVRDLSFSYEKNPILDGVSFAVNEGDFVAIVGENGAGKSTLMNLMLQNLTNYDGEIQLFGVDIKRDNHFRDLAYISQNSVLSYKNFPTTIEECVKIHLSFLKKKADLKFYLEQVGLFEHRKKSLDELSGGQLQRLGIVLALIKDAKIIFLDEPTSGIDEKFADEFFENLSNLKNKTVVIITHQLDLAGKYIDYAIKIKDKKAVRIQKNEIRL